MDTCERFITPESVKTKAALAFEPCSINSSSSVKFLMVIREYRRFEASVGDISKKSPNAWTATEVRSFSSIEFGAFYTESPYSKGNTSNTTKSPMSWFLLEFLRVIATVFISRMRIFVTSRSKSPEFGI